MVPRPTSRISIEEPTDMDWFRWYHGTVEDVKFTTIARRCGQSRGHVLALWALLLERASQAPQRGSIEGLDPEDAGALLDLSADVISVIFDAMKGRLHDGKKLLSWDRRQPERERDSVTGNSWRALKKKEKTDVVANVDGNQRQPRGNHKATSGNRRATLEQNRTDKNRGELTPESTLITNLDSSSDARATARSTPAPNANDSKQPTPESDPAGWVASEFTRLHAECWPSFGERRIRWPASLRVDAQALLDQGASPELVVEALRDGLERWRDDADPPSTVKPFTADVTKAVARTQPAKAASDDWAGQAEKARGAWRAKLLGFVDHNGIWSRSWGPSPCEPGCYAPSDLLAEIIGDRKIEARLLG